MQCTSRISFALKGKQKEDKDRLTECRTLAGVDASNLEADENDWGQNSSRSQCKAIVLGIEQSGNPGATNRPRKELDLRSTPRLTSPQSL
jgi:hypothetical protein